jgi:hypothetical protein
MIGGRYRAGKSSDYTHVRELLNCDKKQAQNKLEYLNDIGKIIPLGFDEGHRKQYGPPEANKRNKPAPSARQEFDNLVAYLKLASHKPVEIHNLELKTTISEEAYRELKDQYRANYNPDNKQVIVPLKVNGQNIHAKISTTGTVEIKSKLSQSPFKLEDEADVFEIAEKLGEWRRAFIQKGLPETMDSPGDWILQKVDINKNVRIREDESKPKLVLYLSIKQAYGAFTTYIKYMKPTNEYEFRVEENRTLYRNPTLTEACDDIMRQEKSEPLEIRVAKALMTHPESGSYVERENVGVEYPLRVIPEYREGMEAENSVIRQSQHDKGRF